MDTGPVLRLARAAVFAAVCTATAGLGHALMSGCAPAPQALATAFTGAAAGAWWLAGRERGPFTVTVSTVVTQLVLHTAFATLSSPPAVHGVPGASPAAPSGAVSAHAHHLMGATAGQPGMAPADHGWSAGMMLAHMLAALVCGVWLSGGEAAAFRLGRSLAALLFAPLRLAALVPVQAAPPVRRRAARDRGRRPRRPLLRHTVSRRGPPGARGHALTA